MLDLKMEAAIKRAEIAKKKSVAKASKMASSKVEVVKQLEEATLSAKKVSQALRHAEAERRVEEARSIKTSKAVSMMSPKRGLPESKLTADAGSPQFPCPPPGEHLVLPPPPAMCDDFVGPVALNSRLDAALDLPTDSSENMCTASEVIVD